jgi:hypothetical protein
VRDPGERDEHGGRDHDQDGREGKDSTPVHDDTLRQRGSIRKTPRAWEIT